MEVIRNVSDIGLAERAVLEHVVGWQLRDNQQLIIRVVSVDVAATEDNVAEPLNGDAGVPSWCSVLEGLSEHDLADVNATLAAPVRLARGAD